jgi:AcrR family transcriptional regulator
MSPRRAKAVVGRVGDDPATALREHLIDHAELLLAQRPAATVTTRDIARAAGVSDGVLYNYFADKHELIVAALLRRFAELMARFATDLPKAGTGTVEANLTNFALAALDLFANALPVAGGVISDPVLLHRLMHAIHSQPFGPHLFRQPIVDYLIAEQALGRLGPFDPEAAASLLIGPTLMLGFAHVIPDSPADHTPAAIPAIVQTLLRGLSGGPAVA